MVDNLKKEISEALKEAALPIKSNRVSNFKEVFESAELEYCILKPTKNGLKKGLMDATRDVRNYLQRLEIHDYSKQSNGEENKKLVEAYFLGPTTKASEASLYRAKKRGDTRIWFKELGSYASSGDALAIIAKENVLYVINTNHSNLNKILSAIRDGKFPSKEKRTTPTLPIDEITDHSTKESTTRETLPTKKVNGMNKIESATEKTTGDLEPQSETSQRPQVFLGEDSRKQPVTWEPFHLAGKLMNGHMAILGASGSGKTQTMKVFIRALADSGAAPIILDFNNDYTGSDFIKPIGAKHHQAMDGLDFNPLIFSKNSTCMTQGYQITAMFTKIFALGAQQQSNFKNAILTAYENHGIRKNVPITTDVEFPRFDELEPILEDIGDQELNNRVSPVFDFNLFRGNTGFQEGFFKEGHVIQLNELPDEGTKKAVAGMVLMGIYNTLIGGNHCQDQFTLALIIDEAHKVANLKETVDLLKEGRKYGCSVFLASQEAKDFGDTIYSNVGSLLCLNLKETRNSEMIARQIGGESNYKSLAEQIRNLGTYEGFFKNDHYKDPFTTVKIKPYIDRFGNYG